MSLKKRLGRIGRFDIGAGLKLSFFKHLNWLSVFLLKPGPKVGSFTLFILHLKAGPQGPKKIPLCGKGSALDYPLEGNAIDLKFAPVCSR